MSTFKKNIFGQYIFLKKFLFRHLGFATRKRYIGFNSLNIEGSEILNDIPQENVLFVANHQTIFADVVAMLHVMFSSLNGQVDSLKSTHYLKNTKHNIYYVAAKETMMKGLLPKVLAYAGAVTVERTWRQGDQMIQRAHNPDDTKQIGNALKDGWVITFPQGTTRPGAHIRKGTAHIIKDYRPLVVPIRVDGFREAFDKTGLKIMKKGVNLSLKFGKPLDIAFDNDSIDTLVKKIGVSLDEDNPEIKKP